MTCLVLPMHISTLGLFAVQSGGSLIFLSSSLGSRKLALNRINHLDLGVVIDTILSCWTVIWRTLRHIGPSVCMSMCPSIFRSARCGSAATADAEEHKGCCWPCHCATAATSVPGAFSGLCQLCHEPSTGKFLLQSCTSHQLAILICVSGFLFQVSTVGAIFTYGAQVLGFAPPQPFVAYLWQAYFDPGHVVRPIPGIHWVAASSTASK